jgi:hypothetical protein
VFNELKRSLSIWIHLIIVDY